MAERVGFEPTEEFDPFTRSPGELLRPLRHLSALYDAAYYIPLRWMCQNIVTVLRLFYMFCIANFCYLMECCYSIFSTSLCGRHTAPWPFRRRVPISTHILSGQSADITVAYPLPARITFWPPIAFTVTSHSSPDSGNLWTVSPSTVTTA